MSFSTRVLKGLPDAIGLAVVAAVLAALLALGIGFGPGTYVELGGDPQANTWHGLPDNNPGNGGSSANPNGNGVNDGNGIHGIANNPGQSGDSPADQGNPSCNMHNGFNGDDTKSQCP